MQVMNKVPNRQAICDTFIELAEKDSDILVLTTDSRGSASLAEFGRRFPKQHIEMGIAEQNAVGFAAGLASCGKKPTVASPACFLSMRSIEQIKVDVAYSAKDVKLLGISGGVSYGALGMSHHSLQDFAVMRAIPGIDIIVPSDRFESQKVMETVLGNGRPAYIRIGRNPVEDVYSDKDSVPFKLGKATILVEGSDRTIIACGETVRIALDAALELQKEGFHTRVINMHTLKPLDVDAIVAAAEETGGIVTIEEHSVFGGLGAAVAEVVAKYAPVRMKIMGIFDEPPITGNQSEMFDYYHLTSRNVCEAVKMI